MDCNCFWRVYGDFLFIRAFKDVAPGEEILIPYVTPTKNYLTRKIDLENKDINCNCRLCQIEKDISEEDLQKKWEIMEKCVRPISSAELKLQTHLLAIRKDLALINLFYRNRKYNLDLMHLRREAYTFYFAQGNFKKAIVELKLAHAFCTGTCLAEDAAAFSINIMSLLLKNEEDKENAKQWVGVLQKDLINAYGTVNVSFINDFNPTLATMLSAGIQFPE